MWDLEVESPSCCTAAPAAALEAEAAGPTSGEPRGGGSAGRLNLPAEALESTGVLPTPPADAAAAPGPESEGLRAIPSGAPLPEGSRSSGGRAKSPRAEAAEVDEDAEDEEAEEEGGEGPAGGSGGPGIANPPCGGTRAAAAGEAEGSLIPPISRAEPAGGLPGPAEVDVESARGRGGGSRCGGIPPPTPPAAPEACVRATTRENVDVATPGEAAIPITGTGATGKATWGNSGGGAGGARSAGPPAPVTAATAAWAAPVDAAVGLPDGAGDGVPRGEWRGVAEAESVAGTAAEMGSGASGPVCNAALASRGMDDEEDADDAEEEEKEEDDEG